MLLRGKEGRGYRRRKGRGGRRAKEREVKGTNGRVQELLLRDGVGREGKEK